MSMLKFIFIIKSVSLNFNSNKYSLWDDYMQA